MTTKTTSSAPRRTSATSHTANLIAEIAELGRGMRVTLAELREGAARTEQALSPSRAEENGQEQLWQRIEQLEVENARLSHELAQARVDLMRLRMGDSPVEAVAPAVPVARQVATVPAAPAEPAVGILKAKQQARAHGHGHAPGGRKSAHRLAYGMGGPAVLPTA